jgi:hypothetical protein
LGQLFFFEGELCRKVNIVVPLILLLCGKLKEGNYSREEIIGGNTIIKNPVTI